MFQIKNTRFLQYLAATSAAIITISMGTLATWPSPTLPLLTSEETPLNQPLTEEEASWIPSVPLLTCLPFVFVGGYILDKFGRKKSLLISAIPLGIPWIMIIFAKSFEVLCIARAISGLGVSVMVMGVPMYCAEIADNDIRGRLGTIMLIMSCLGNVMVLGIGPFISYTALALLCLSVPVLFVLTFSFMPESPFYYAKMGKIDEARSALVKIAPSNRDKAFFDEKIEEILSSIDEQKGETSAVHELFTKPEYRKALFIVIALKTFQDCSGNVAMSPYLQTILEASNTDIPAEISSAIFGAISMPSVLLSAWLVDKFGRKPLLIISAFGSALGLIAEGAYFYSKEVLGADLTSFFWLPTTALVFYLFVVSLGVASLPYVIFGEILATNVKGMAMSVVIFWSTVVVFTLTKLFQPMANQFGIYSLFWFFATSCLGCCFFVYFWVPETKGISLADIQKKLRNEDAPQTEKNVV